MINWIKTKRFNLIFLQETFITNSLSPEFENDINSFGSAFQSISDTSHGKGVAIILTKHFPDYTLIDKHIDIDGRKILINIRLNDSNEIFTLVCIYAPNDVNQRIIFLKKLDTWITKNCANQNNILIGSDFNCCDSENDRFCNKLDKSSKFFTNLKVIHNLSDIYRWCNPNKIEFSYNHPSIKSRNSRIDFILASNHLSGYAKASIILYAPAPDHKAVGASFDSNYRKQEKGYWKLNNSILSEDKYRLLIKNIISETRLEYSGFISKQNLLEMLKYRVKEQTIKYCIDRSRDKKRISQELEDKLKIIETALNTNNNNNKDIYEQSLIIKDKLDTFYTDAETQPLFAHVVIGLKKEKKIHPIS